MALQGNIQVVVQYPGGGAADVCRGFAGLPTTQSALFCVQSAEPAADADAQRLGEELAEALLRLAPTAREPAAPCGGNSALGECHAHQVGDCAKVLLVVCRPSTTKVVLYPSWATQAPGNRIIPIVTAGATGAMLPAQLKHLNPIDYLRGDDGALTAILAAAGIVWSRRRIFLSYVRADTDDIAEQLFEELPKDGFDVFQDRFCVAPGADWQARLHEEMSRAGTLLVLESPRIRASQWVQLEVNFARAHRLGLMALNVARGPEVLGLHDNQRRRITNSELSGKRLAPTVMDEIRPWIRKTHAAAEHRRRVYLRDCMRDALLMAGIKKLGFEKVNVLHAQSPAGKKHTIRLSNLPPELHDFHTIEAHRTSQGRTLVVGPAMHMDWRRRQPLAWLAKETGIELHDESAIWNLARSMR